MRAFHKRLDQLYGGAEARQALDQQLEEAKEDRLRLVASLNGGATSNEISELDAFIADISARRFRSPFLSPRVLDLLIVWNALLLLLPLTWSIATAGVILNGSQYYGARIDAVVPDGAAAAGGLKSGDIVMAINGQRVMDILTMKRIVALNPGHPLVFQVQRGPERVELKLAPRATDGDHGTAQAGRTGVLGIIMQQPRYCYCCPDCYCCP